MENTINWIYGDFLYTQNCGYEFKGQDKGRLYFSDGEHLFVESPKIVYEMISIGMWSKMRWE